MKLAVFDVDNVLVRGQSQLKFAWFLFCKGRLSICLIGEIGFSFLLYKLGMNCDLDRLREKSFLVFRGWTKAELQSLCDEFYRKVLVNAMISPCVELLEEHQKAGHQVLLLSASLYPIVDLLRLNLGVQYCIATFLEMQEGVYSGRINGSVPYGQVKMDCVRHFVSDKDVDWKGSYVYADHCSDEIMMSIFGNPVAVNPDKGLLTAARKYGWKVMVV